jgi:hypothetical protein
MNVATMVTTTAEAMKTYRSLLLPSTSVISVTGLASAEFLAIILPCNEM